MVHTDLTAEKMAHRIVEACSNCWWIQGKLKRQDMRSDGEPERGLEETPHDEMGGVVERPWHGCKKTAGARGMMSPEHRERLEGEQTRRP